MSNPRFERTLSAVMWLDAFLSVAMAVLCLVAAPVVAAVGLPRALLTAVVGASIVSAVLLAAFGAITAVVLMLRLRDGDYLLPRRLRLPLPPGMSPPLR